MNMSIKDKKSPFAIVAGAAMATTLALSINAAQAGENPFQANQLSSGYQVADNAEGKCGEGKCGENKAKEGKCGEGKCGENKAKHKDKEGKCGEGKCGENKKSHEGKCGEGKCGEKK